MENFRFFIPTDIHFGAGKLDALRKLRLPGKKALIVTTGGGSVRRYGYLDRLTALLAANNDTRYALFDKVLPNPTLAHVREAAALCRAEGCDFLIGLGGGSPIDTAKAVAVAAANPLDYWQYASGQAKPAGALPVVAITTTAGTGTEADPWTVITDEQTNQKIGFGFQGTFPVLSIVDPELMLTVPPALTAYQGFDAFFHAAEGYIANIATPVSDLFALRSMSLLSEALPAAVAFGNDLEARTKVALANTLSGMVESTSSCTSEHSMEHALSGFYPALPHGAGLIMLSLAYFTHFAPLAAERFTAMARNMGVDTDALPEKERPMAFVHALAALQKACGVDNLKMSDYGITRDDFPRMVRKAREVGGGLFAFDPEPLSDADVTAIFEKSFR